MVSVTGIPSWSLPTSVSSTFPRNIMSFMSATTAIVVPSLNVLDWMTELPTLTGMSSIMPSNVERIWVLLISALRETMPSRTISRLSRALWKFSSAIRSCVSAFSNSSRVMTFFR